MNLAVLLENKWDNDKRTLESWLEQLEAQMDLIDLADAGKKTKALCAAVSQEAYETLKNLTTPKKPTEVEYTELRKLLVDYVKPKPVTMVERFNFSKICQRKDEDVTEYLARVKRGAEYCDYKDFYNDAVRDRFVGGMSDRGTQRVLLAETDLKVETAYTKALAREQAGLNTATIHPGGSLALQEQVDKVEVGNKKFTNNRFKTPGKQGSSSTFTNQGKGGSKNSFTCGRCKLPRSKCTKDKCVTKCYKCKRAGHSTLTCRSNVNNVDSVESSGDNAMHCIDIFSSKVVNSKSKPFVQMNVQNKVLSFEFDTGSAITVISRSTFNEYFTNTDLSLERSSKVIRVANGALVDDLNKCTVWVSHDGGKPLLVVLYVVESEFPSLLGRDWIRILFGDDWLEQVITKQVNQVRQDSLRVNEVICDRERVLEPDPGTVQVVSQEVPNCRERVTEPDPTVFKVISYNADFEKHPVFREELGLVEMPAELKLIPDAREKFRKFTKFKAPEYNIRQKLLDTLDEMEADGRLIPVDSSPIVSPMRIVPKRDGSLRVCGDYKRTLNPVLDTKQYPLPTPEECFYPMQGGEKFSKIDIRAAYNHIALREEDQYLTTMATPQGLKKWTRLPYGISSALAIFQERIEQVLAGIDKCVCRVDDILLTGVDDADHHKRLTLVLDTLYKAGFRCRLDKSEFLKEEVVYLGYRVTKVGITPCNDKVRTLLKAEYPQNKDQLIAFLGAVNYYGNFLPNMATVIEPLNRLRARDVHWKFEDVEKTAFNNLKQMLASSKVLMQYNPELPLKIDTDASKYGLGAVISHTTKDGERPIEFASRTLTKAERNYSQIEKEALAIVWAVKKFHRYIYAREYQLITDHKPLTYLFGEHKDIPEMGASRLQRWAILLMSYKYTIKYRETKKHSNADMCSRYPLKVEADEGDVALQEDVFSADMEEVVEVFQAKYADKELINHQLVASYSRNDVTISKVIKQVQEGLISPRCLPAPFDQRRDELSVESNCLLWGTRVVIPEKLRPGVLELLHATHPGIVNMKALARMYFWWPGITSDIEKLAKNCGACRLNQDNPQKTRIHPWIPATKPWQRIHIDFCQYESDNWLVIVDAYSKWTEIINMKKNTESSALIRELRKVFATFGLPSCTVSDNGPQLVSEETRQFYRDNGIEFIPIPSYKPQCNGLAERMVRSFKAAMKKMKLQNRDVTKNVACWLLTYRNTPHATTKQTPTELMFGRRTRSLLSLMYPQPRTSTRLPGQPQVYREFQVNDQVLYKDVRHDTWNQGTVVGREGSKVYLVKGRDEGTHRKHIDQLTDGLNPDGTSNHDPPNVSNQCKPTPLDLPVAANKHNVSILPSTSGVESNVNAPEPRVERTAAPSCEPPESILPAVSVSNNPVRTSARVTRSVERLNYDKLGGP